MKHKDIAIKELINYKKDLISKYEIQAKVLLDMMGHPDTTETESETLAACRRFVVGIIDDLKKI